MHTAACCKATAITTPCRYSPQSMSRNPCDTTVYYGTSIKYIVNVLWN